jgi:hypothetical protein
MNIDIGKSIPEFYKETINCWVEFGGQQTKTPTNFREIRNRNICGNKYTKFIVVFTYFSSDNSTYHSLGIDFSSRKISLKKLILFFNISNK